MQLLSPAGSPALLLANTVAYARDVCPRHASAMVTQRITRGVKDIEARFARSFVDKVAQAGDMETLDTASPAHAPSAVAPAANGAARSDALGAVPPEVRQAVARLAALLDQLGGDGPAVPDPGVLVEQASALVRPCGPPRSCARRATANAHACARARAGASATFRGAATQLVEPDIPSSARLAVGPLLTVTAWLADASPTAAGGMLDNVMNALELFFRYGPGAPAGPTPLDRYLESWPGAPAPTAVQVHAAAVRHQLASPPPAAARAAV